MVRIGFIGLGTMGGAMASHILNSEYDLTVYDIREEAMNRFVEEGAKASSSPRTLAADVDVVFLSLPRPEHVKAVVMGEDGLRDGLSAGDVVVDLSTSTPETTSSISNELEAVGVSVLGAPVSGGKAGAEAGEVPVMVGGDEDVLATIEPIMDSFAGDVFHVGDQPNQGHAMKLLQNYLNFTAMVATSEAIVLGEAVGLDMETMLDVFNASSAKNIATDVKFPQHVVPRTFDRGFTMELTEKDIKLFMQFGEEYDVPLVLGSTVRQLIGYARLSLGDDADQTRLYEYFKETMATDN